MTLKTLQLIFFLKRHFLFDIIQQFLLSQTRRQLNLPWIYVLFHIFHFSESKICFHFIQKNFLWVASTRSMSPLFQPNFCNLLQLYRRIIWGGERRHYFILLYFGGVKYGSSWSLVQLYKPNELKASESLLGTSAGQKEKVSWYWRESLHWF